MEAVVLEKVSKAFPSHSFKNTYTTLKTELLNALLMRKDNWRRPQREVLKDIDLRVLEGQSFGIIGRNGSGKSTLLKLIAGIYKPDKGKVKVHGRLSALLELGTGFHPEFSGRENVFLNGMILGLSKKEIKRRFEEIVEFAGLEEYIDEPLRVYSSGMYLRLGFSVAVHVDPDILLVDEMLAVGDADFAQKGLMKMQEFKRKGKTIILVSHELPLVEQWCEEVAWLEDGVIEGIGEPQLITELYRERILGSDNSSGLLKEEKGPPLEQPKPEGQRRWGNGDGLITSVKMRDSHHKERYEFTTGEKATIEIGFELKKAIPLASFGIGIVREDGTCCYGTNMRIDKKVIPLLHKDGKVLCSLESLDLLPGTYFLDVALQSDQADCDYITRYLSFQVLSDLAEEAGVFRPRHQWIKDF